MHSVLHNNICFFGKLNYALLIYHLPVQLNKPTIMFLFTPLHYHKGDFTLSVISKNTVIYDISCQELIKPTPGIYLYVKTCCVAVKVRMASRFCAHAYQLISANLKVAYWTMKYFRLKHNLPTYVPYNYN